MLSSSDGEGDWSHYLQHRSNLSNIFALLSGFLPPLIFYVLGLAFLSYASSIAWLLVIVTGVGVIWKPFERRPRKETYQRKEGR